MRYLLLLLALSGCLPSSYDTIPGQHDATVIVWDLTYNMLNVDPPAVEWIKQKDLDCDDQGSGFLGFHGALYLGAIKNEGRCVGGLSWSDWYLSQVALPDNFVISATSFAHELYHMSLWKRYGDADSGHSDPGFGANYGYPVGIVDAANITLVQYGL